LRAISSFLAAALRGSNAFLDIAGLFSACRWSCGEPYNVQGGVVKPKCLWKLLKKVFSVWLDFSPESKSDFR
jgi:hypothetical protein